MTVHSYTVQYVDPLFGALPLKNVRATVTPAGTATVTMGSDNTSWTVSLDDALLPQNGATYTITAELVFFDAADSAPNQTFTFTVGAAPLPPPSDDDSWCTLERARIISGQAGVTPGALLQANFVVENVADEVLANRPQLRALDVKRMEYAVAVTAAHLLSSPDTTSKLYKTMQLAASFYDDGSGMTFKPAFDLLPREAKLALGRLSWKRSRSVKLRRASDLKQRWSNILHQYQGLFVNSVSEDTGWSDGAWGDW